MRNLLDKLYMFGGGLAAVFMFGIFTIVLLQVCTNLVNYIGGVATGESLGLSIPSYAEIAGFFLAGTSFLALPYALRHGTHIRVNLFIQKLPSAWHHLADAWSFFVGFVISLWLNYHCWELVKESFEYGDLSPGLIAVPIWIPQFVMSMGISLFSIAMLDGFFTSLAKKSFFDTSSKPDLGAE
jgi:TRAP-type C4-dicarboxylate transport system permease small subunit